MKGPTVKGPTVKGPTLFRSSSNLVEAVRSAWKEEPIRVGATLLFVAISLFGAKEYMYARGYRVQGGGSAALGIYRLEGGVHRPLERGDMVAVCLDGWPALMAKERGYLPLGSCPSGITPILKEVRGVAGDRIRVVEGRLVIGLERQPPLSETDSEGRTLEPVRDWGGVVPEGEVWLTGLTRRPRSWDSRYFGPIPESWVLSLVEPVQLIRGSPPGWT